MRCFVCKKKLGLVPFKCKCGTFTCSNHKWPDHDCNFDFHHEYKQILKKHNPKIISEKINKI